MSNPYFTGCRFCFGDGRVEVGHDERGDPTEFRECGECDGVGMNLTDQGIDLLVFIRRLDRAESRKQ